MVSVTSAMPVGLRSRVPLKMTSAIRSPRNDLADCSPSTQLMASLTLDLPHPFGPTIAATPPPGKFMLVRSQNDLNPTMSTRLSFSKGGILFHVEYVTLVHPTSRVPSKAREKYLM